MFLSSVLMAWMVSLAAKLIGKEIPSVSRMAPGGKIIAMGEREVVAHLQSMLALGEAMSREGKWKKYNPPDREENSILEVMLHDLRVLTIWGQPWASNLTPMAAE